MIAEIDALGAPQGRAEDIAISLGYTFNENTSGFLGYRLLEGGADSDKVYTFALINYLFVGLQVRY